MSSGEFSVETLSEKLVKLNASQQTIETLSHWCIYHRKKAKLIAKTWEKEFFNAPKEKRVSFLYLANDIIQNSRRKGAEFVSEFWRVLSNPLKDVKENGDENGRNAVSRLINIWEQRKVFGSRGQGLKETLLGNNPVPELEETQKEKEKPSTPSSFLKIKLDGGTLEKLAKAFKEVNNGAPNEDAAIEECNSTKRRIDTLVKEVAADETSNAADELQQQEVNLTQVVEHLETYVQGRLKLVTTLREALYEQEAKLEHLRSQIQGFRAASATQNMAPIDKKPKEAPSAAELAAKLASSASSAAVLSSILSSLSPEELGIQQTDKRPRLESTPTSVSTSAPPQYLHPSVLQHPQYVSVPQWGIPPPMPPPIPPPGVPPGVQQTRPPAGIPPQQQVQFPPNSFMPPGNFYPTQVPR